MSVISVKGIVDVPGSYATPIDFAKNFNVVQVLDIEIAASGGSASIPFDLITTDASFVFIVTNQKVTVSPASGTGEDFVLLAGGIVLLADAAAWREMTITNDESSVAVVRVLLGD